MKGKAVFFSLLIALVAGGCATFSTSVVPEYRRTSVAITWEEVDDVGPACFMPRQKILACAFIDENPCRIVTYREPDWATLGHEVGHCFKGRWHPQKETIDG